jgi:ATP-dependent DNA ligase
MLGAGDLGRLGAAPIRGRVCAALPQAYHRRVPDQLSLSLTGDFARLPRSMRPMMPRGPEAPFDSDEHVFEPSWGGRRALAFIEPGRPGKPIVRLLDELGRDLAPHLPELASIAGLVAETPAILDGEVVVPDRAGRMDPEALAGRMADGQATGLAPVYLVFDLLWAGGQPLVAQPLLKRRERLAKTVKPGPELVIVPGVVRDGRDLHAAVAQQGLAGVMGRHLRSPYLPGRHSDLWHWLPTDPSSVPPAPPLDRAPSARPVLSLIQRLPFED